MTHDEARARIARQFDEGLLAPLEAQALRAHLRQCAACRAIYDAHAQVERALDGGANQAARLVLRGAPPVTPARPGLRRFVWAAAATVAAAAGLLFWIMRPDIEPLIARGDPTPVPSAVHVFVLKGDRPVKIAADAGIPRDAALLFAYTNPTASPARHLAIVGRDAAGALRWYHPQWLSAADAPKSVAIRAGVADQPLPDAVRHPYPPGPLEICGIFSAEPRAIPALDADLSRAWPPSGPCVRLEVFE